MGKFQTIDLSGQKFNYLTVIKQVPRPAHIKCNHTFWLCKCDCGNEKIIDQRALKSGNTKSCGCYSHISSRNNLINYLKTIPKTKNKFIKEDGYYKLYTKKGIEFLIDEDDFEDVYQHYWILRGNYICSKFAEKQTPRYTILHRFIIKNIPEGMQIDHINRNTLDNRKSNLRIVTPHENMMNRRITSKSKNGGFNVYYRPSKNKYEASFSFNKKHYWVGTFDDLKTAENAVLEKRKEIGGLLYEQRNCN